MKVVNKVRNSSGSAVDKYCSIVNELTRLNTAGLPGNKKEYLGSANYFMKVTIMYVTFFKITSLIIVIDQYQPDL